MPRARIWDVEGRVQGTNLGNGRFQFDFDNEEDLEKVLKKRPCYFNQWSFSLERWEPNIREDFPNTMLFWIQVTGIPSQFKKVETFEDLGKSLGDVRDIEVKGARIQVSLNADKPMKFVKKAGFDNGDVVSVSLKYEELLRYCFTCRRISHEERTYPELTEEERIAKRQQRVEESRREAQLRWEQNNFPLGLPSLGGPRIDKSLSLKRKREVDYQGREDKRRRDLRDDIQSQRDSRGKEVWNRLGKRTQNPYPRYGERLYSQTSGRAYDRSRNYRENYDVSSSRNTRRTEFRDESKRPTWNKVPRDYLPGKYSTRNKPGKSQAVKEASKK